MKFLLVTSHSSRSFESLSLRSACNSKLLRQLLQKQVSSPEVSARCS